MAAKHSLRLMRSTRLSAAGVFALARTHGQSSERREMRKYLRSALTGVVAVGSVVALAACGSSSTTPSPGASGTGTGAAPAGAVKSGGTATIDSGTAPLSADQGLDF